MNWMIKGFLLNTFAFILYPLRAAASFIRRVFPFFKWLSTLKPEILAALLTFVFLMLIWIFSRFASGDANAVLETQRRDMLIALAVICAIPIVLYFFLRILLQPPKSPFPDIDESWQMGLQELAKQGLVIQDVPLYLVVGLRDSKQIRRFIEGSGREFDIEGTTGSGQTLIWYASKDEVFLFLSNVGNFTEFSAKSQKLRLLHGNDEMDFTSTAQIGDFYKVPRSSAMAGRDEPDDQNESFMGTIRAADAMPTKDAPTPRSPARDETGEDQEPIRQSARAKLNLERKRLNHLAHLIHRARMPVSPINGILVNANVNLLESYPEEMARQLRDDLHAIASELGVICAVTTVITGLESDRGFVNFAERLIKENGPEFRSSKFGKSYRTWTAPSTEQLEQIAAVSVEEFDHFAHLLFSKRDALAGEHIQGNRDLVQFLCRLYSTILPGLKVVLGKGCGIGGSNEAEFPRFAGCYFVGQDHQQNYFLQKVFERVEENQGELEWTQKSLSSEENWSMITNLGYLVGLASLITFAFLIFLWQENGS